MRPRFHTDECCAAGLAQLYQMTIEQALRTFRFYDRRLAPDELRLIDRQCSCGFRRNLLKRQPAKIAKASGRSADKWVEREGRQAQAGGRSGSSAAL